MKLSFIKFLNILFSNHNFFFHNCHCRGAIAAQFTRVLHRSPNHQYLITGNYVFDYQDKYRKFGAMIGGIVIANPLTNMPEVLYVTVNNYGSGININHVSVSTAIRIKILYH